MQSPFYILFFICDLYLDIRKHPNKNSCKCLFLFEISIFRVSLSAAVQCVSVAWRVSTAAVLQWCCDVLHVFIKAFKDINPRKCGYCCHLCWILQSFYSHRPSLSSSSRVGFFSCFHLRWKTVPTCKIYHFCRALEEKTEKTEHTVSLCVFVVAM